MLVFLNDRITKINFRNFFCVQEDAQNRDRGVLATDISATLPQSGNEGVILYELRCH